MEFVNLSGGIGIPYRPEEPEADLQSIGQGVREAYNRVVRPAAGSFPSRRSLAAT